MKTEIQKILVTQTGKLGDMVCTTPVFRAIKKQYPQSRLTVLGDSLNRLVLQGNPHIDSYIELKDFTSEILKKESFDTAILLNPNPRILWKLIAARISHIIAPKITNGYSPIQTKKYRIMLLFVTKAIHRMKEYAPQEYLNALQKIGIHTTDTKKELYIESNVKAEVDGLFLQYNSVRKIAIAPGAGNTIKEWPPENFSRLMMELHEQYPAVFFIIGGKQEEPLRDTLLSGARDIHVVDTVGRLSIEELKAYVSHMDIFISADTGPIYIAEAFDIPTVDIIGPIDEREQPPRGENHISVIPPNRRKPELYVMNARSYDYDEAHRLATTTPVSAVLSAVNSLLKIKNNV